MAFPKPKSPSIGRTTQNKGIEEKGISEKGLDSPMTVVSVPSKLPSPFYISLANWVPDSVRQYVKVLELEGALERNKLFSREDHRYVQRFTQADGRTIVLWIGISPFNQVTLEVYQEFPKDMSFYLDYASGDKNVARLLHFAHNRWDEEMWYLIYERKKSPDQAKQELRRIYHELANLILNAIAKGEFSIGAIASSIQSLAKPIALAAKRTKNIKIIPTKPSPPIKSETVPKGTPMIKKLIRPVNRTINVGGGLEGGIEAASQYSNLNPIIPGTGGPATGIPNHIKAGFEQIADVFEPGSADRITSNRLPFATVDWAQSAVGSYKVMASGGRIELNIWTTSAKETELIIEHFRRAGFKKVQLLDPQYQYGTATIITGFK